MSSERVRLARPPRTATVLPGSSQETLDLALEHLRTRALEAQGQACRERSAGAAAEALRAAAERLDQAAEALERRREELADEAVRDAVELALQIAEHLVRAEVRAGRHDVERLVRDALATAGSGRGVCVVHLSPDDARALASTRFRSGTEIREDLGVRRGDVHVETSQGVLVAELSEALAGVRERLLEEL